MTFNILGPIRICDIFWGFLLYEMLQVLVPKLNKYNYSGKSFKIHYHSDNSYDKTKLLEYTKKNTKKAINAFIYWTLTNIVMLTIYYKLNLNRDYLFMLFLFYYWMDVFCINIWCPFQNIFVRDKCCNECSIYKWVPLM